MPLINYTSILEKISKVPRVKEIAYQNALERFETAKEEMLNFFDEHNITQELEEGPNGSNISGTLGGYGNLFSFIGFFEGEEPTDTIRKILIDLIKLNKTPSNIKTFKTSNRIEIKFRVRLPSLQEIYDNTPYPDNYRAGSWVKDLTRGGIQGLSYYLYDDDFGKYSQSRSTAGLQATTKKGSPIVIRSGNTSTPIEYISEILNLFKGTLKLV